MKLIMFALIIFLVACNAIKNNKNLSEAMNLVSKKMDTNIMYKDDLSPDVPTLSLEFKNKSEKYDLFESRLVFNCFEILSKNERQYKSYKVIKNKEFFYYSKYNLDRIAKLKVHSEKYLEKLRIQTNQNDLIEIDTTFLKKNQFNEASQIIKEHISKIEFKGFKTGESQGVSMIQLYFSINSKDDITYLVFNEQSSDFKLVGFGINP